MVIISTALWSQENAINACTAHTALNSLCMPWYRTILLCYQNYSAMSLAIGRPSLSPLFKNQPRCVVQGRGFPAITPAARSRLSCCLWATILRCPESGVSGSWPRCKILYDIMIGNATIHGLALWLQYSDKFIGVISVCCRRLNGLHCLLLTSEESASCVPFST